MIPIFPPEILNDILSYLTDYPTIISFKRASTLTYNLVKQQDYRHFTSTRPITITWTELLIYSNLETINFPIIVSISYIPNFTLLRSLSKCNFIISPTLPSEDVIIPLISRPQASFGFLPLDPSSPATKVPRTIQTLGFLIYQNEQIIIDSEYLYRWIKFNIPRIYTHQLYFFPASLIPHLSIISTNYNVTLHCLRTRIGTFSTLYYLLTFLRYPSKAIEKILSELLIPLDRYQFFDLYTLEHIKEVQEDLGTIKWMKNNLLFRKKIIFL